MSEDETVVAYLLNFRDMLWGWEVVGTGSGRCPLTYIGSGVKLAGCATSVCWLEYFTQCNTWFLHCAEQSRFYFSHAVAGQVRSIKFIARSGVDC